jgi:anaerobic magnesium-protoporphyrin IX monomethyl ester cyclase
LHQCPAADFAVVGEGEIPMRDLCLGSPLDGIPGLLYRSNGAILSGGPPRLVQDLDSLPFPRFASYPLDRYTDEIEIVTSRGCPHGCIFCAVSNIMGRGLRYRSPRSVGDEIEYFYRRGVRSFQFGDDNFLADRSRVLAILGEIRARNLDDLLLRCGQGIRADLLDREILVEMKQAGFRHLGIGVESASDRVLAVIGKHETVDRIEHGIALACELGFDVSLFFVVGTPTETPADVERSVALARKYPVMKAFFFNLVPFPGTRLYDWVSRHRAMVAPYEELMNRADELKLRTKPFFATADMTEAERIAALRMTERASKEIQVRALRRKLSRLGPLGTLIAQAARFDVAERLFVRHRRLRRFLDRLMFRSGMRRASR